MRKGGKRVRGKKKGVKVIGSCLLLGKKWKGEKKLPKKKNPRYMFGHLKLRSEGKEDNEARF